MHRKMLFRTLVAMAIPAILAGQDRGAKKPRIDVENYVINAEVNPHTQALNARTSAFDSASRLLWRKERRPP
jgi:hypothetical protein